MTDETNQADLNEENAIGADVPEQQEWVPPETLPAPITQASSSPMFAFVAASVAAIAAGLAISAVAQAFYVYILFNVAIGAAIGAGLSLAPKRAGFDNLPILIAGVVGTTLLAYTALNFGLYVATLLSVASKNDVPVDAVVSQISFWQFFKVRMEVETFFGAELGTIGNLVILLVEMGITIHTGIQKVQEGIGAARISRLPNEVLHFVVSGLANGWTSDQMRRELSLRGWRRPEDVELAMGVSYDVISTIQQQEVAA